MFNLIFGLEQWCRGFVPRYTFEVKFFLNLIRKTLHGSTIRIGPLNLQFRQRLPHLDLRRVSSRSAERHQPQKGLHILRQFLVNQSLIRDRISAPMHALFADP